MRPSTKLRMRGYENPARGDSSMGSELKAVEEACREALERSNHASSVPLR